MKITSTVPPTGSRKVLGIICTIYAILMAVSIITAFFNPHARANFLSKQIVGILGLAISCGAAWYFLRHEKIIPVEAQK